MKNIELIPLQIEDKIITIRSQNVILDFDVATLYGVQTKEINQAIKNNPKKFPRGYVFELKSNEFHALRSKILTAPSEQTDNQYVSTIRDLSTHLEKTRTRPTAFTEKGLYMLATILKSEQAINATIEIIEAFTKIRELSRAVVELAETPDDEQKQMSIMQKSGEILSEIVKNDLKTKSTETSFELNLLAMVKVKHTIKREREGSE